MAWELAGARRPEGRWRQRTRKGRKRQARGGWVVMAHAGREQRPVQRGACQRAKNGRQRRARGRREHRPLQRRSSPAHRGWAPATRSLREGAPYTCSTSSGKDAVLGLGRRSVLAASVRSFTSSASPASR